MDWHLDCIGKTDLQPDHFSKVTSLVKDCGLTDRISFKGAVSATELKQVYNSAHVFVLPSLYEGYGMVFAEAIASGLPVIGTLAGAIPDTVPPGCGVLVPPGNVEALAQALETMISNPDRRQAFRIAAMNAADSFPTWHDSARKFSEFIDNDDALLGIARESAKDDHMEFSQCDLSQSLDLLFKDGPSLITTSAFLDLVSLKWLTKLCGEITRRKIPFYAALSYDGRCVCDPPHIHDDKVLTAFNRHQGTDKGFGPALGPKAAKSAVALFEKAGYLVSMAQSDWIGDKRHPEFQEMLLKGWWEAACEVNPDESGCFDNWLKDRLWLLNNGNSTVRVGHLYIFAVPKD